MSTNPTAKSLHPKATLLLHPGTTDQRAARVVLTSMGREAPAESWAHSKWPGVPKAWLDHESGAVIPIPEPAEAVAA